MAPRMAFVGMGQMGQAISKNLATKGSLDAPIVLWNRTSSTVQKVVSDIGPSACVAASLVDAVAGADVVWTCLKDDAAIQAVFERILSTNVKGKTFVDCSSIPVDTTNTLANRVSAVGAEFVAMPVFGDPGMAEKALLICIPCGPKQAVKQVKPYLEGVIAATVVDMSDETPGNASTIKLIGNTLLMAALNSIAEALAFADKTGVGAKHMAALIGALFPRPPHALYLQRMMSGEYHSGTAMADLAMARGLSSKVLAMADGSGASVPAYRIAVDRLAEAEQASSPNADITAIYGAVREASGLPFKNV